jgi:hypothetical protein
MPEPLEGEVAHVVGYVPKAAYGVRQRPSTDDVEIPCCAYRDQSPCMVEAEVFPRR